MPCARMLAVTTHLISSPARYRARRSWRGILKASRRRTTRTPATCTATASEPADDSVDVGGEAERAETVALVRAAVGGLNEGERDVINQLWHGLDVTEVAAVLGVSRTHAYSRRVVSGPVVKSPVVRSS